MHDELEPQFAEAPVKPFNSLEMQQAIDATLARFSHGERYGRWVLTFEGMEDTGDTYLAWTGSTGLQSWDVFGFLEFTKQQVINFGVRNNCPSPEVMSQDAADDVMDDDDFDMFDDDEWEDDDDED